MSPPTPRVTTLLLIARESVVTWSATSSSSSASSRISSLKTVQNSRPLSCLCDVHTCAPKRFRRLCSGLWGYWSALRTFCAMSAIRMSSAHSFCSCERGVPH